MMTDWLNVWTMLWLTDNSRRSKVSLWIYCIIYILSIISYLCMQHINWILIRRYIDKFTNNFIACSASTNKFKCFVWRMHVFSYTALLFSHLHTYTLTHLRTDRKLFFLISMVCFAILISLMINLHNISGDKYINKLLLFILFAQWKLKFTK